jgi:hypothetical protein
MSLSTALSMNTLARVLTLCEILASLIWNRQIGTSTHTYAACNKAPAHDHNRTTKSPIVTFSIRTFRVVLATRLRAAVRRPSVDRVRGAQWDTRPIVESFESRLPNHPSHCIARWGGAERAPMPTAMTTTYRPDHSRHPSPDLVLVDDHWNDESFFVVDCCC